MSLSRSTLLRMALLTLIVVVVTPGANAGKPFLMDAGSSYGLTAGSFGAPTLELGKQFRVDDASNQGSRHEPRISRVSDDDFVVAWSSSSGPRGRRVGFDAPLAAEFALPFTPSDMAGAPGSFWATALVRVTGPPPFPYQIVMQRYDAAGTPLTPRLAVSTPRSDLAPPRIARADDGSFMVAWYREDCAPFADPREPASLSCSWEGPFGQGFLASGEPAGEVFSSDDRLAQTCVIAGPPGEFVISGTAGYYGPVKGQVRALDGNPLGPTYLLDGADEIARLAGGDFATVWVPEVEPGDPREIRVRRFAPDGSPRGPATAVLSCLDCRVERPAVAAGASDDLLVVFGYRLLGTTDRRVAAVWEGPTGIVSPPAFLNTRGEPEGYDPIAWVAADPGGDFLVAWLSSDPGAQEASIQARAVLSPTLFQDGFESGDTSAWDQAVP